MKREVRVIGLVRHDLWEIESWYRAIDARLAIRLRAEFRRTIEHLADFSEAHALFYRDVRHVVFRGFPYALFYRIKNDIVRVVLVYHAARDPKNLRQTLRGRD